MIFLNKGKGGQIIWKTLVTDKSYLNGPVASVLVHICG